MKSLLLIRHAKSDWNDASLNDFDRPLNERGKKNAPEMAQRLRSKKIKIDAFISSPAKRAKKTAALFANEFDIKKDDIIFKDELYGAGERVFFELIKKIDDKFKSVAIFSHNPGLTDFANALTLTKIDNIPTCSIFAVKIDIDSWAEFEKAEKTFWFFDCPKSEP
jgi:phosphohistidine phosphatase